MLMVWFMEKKCCDQTTPISIWSLASRVFIRSNLGWERPRWWDSLEQSWQSPSSPAAPGWPAPGATPQRPPGPPGTAARRPGSGSSFWNRREREVRERWERERRSNSCFLAVSTDLAGSPELQHRAGGWLWPGPGSRPGGGWGDISPVRPRHTEWGPTSWASQLLQSGRTPARLAVENWARMLPDNSCRCFLVISLLQREGRGAMKYRIFLFWCRIFLTLLQNVNFVLKPSPGKWIIWIFWLSAVQSWRVGELWYLNIFSRSSQLLPTFICLILRERRPEYPGEKEIWNRENVWHPVYLFSD